MNKIKEIRRSRKLTQAHVAQAMGMDLSNYNKLENGKTELTTAKMERLAEILSCAPADFLGQPNRTRGVPVVGWVQAGDWAESHVWQDESQRYTVAIPHDPEYDAVLLTGVETRGPSMNRRYPEGTVLVYANIFDTRERLANGKRYIVERVRADGLRETTVKQLVLTETGEAWMMPESTDPHHQQPIPINGGEGDEIRVLGRVVYSVQREE